jgi:hypothetical protein
MKKKLDTTLCFLLPCRARAVMARLCFRVHVAPVSADATFPRCRCEYSSFLRQVWLRAAASTKPACARRPMHPGQTVYGHIICNFPSLSLSLSLSSSHLRQDFSFLSFDECKGTLQSFRPLPRSHSHRGCIACACMQRLYYGGGIVVDQLAWQCIGTSIVVDQLASVRPEEFNYTVLRNFVIPT